MVGLSTEKLAARWNKSPRTLEQWRWLGKGPVFLKIGASVLYPLEGIEKYEADHLCQNTSGPLSSEDT